MIQHIRFILIATMIVFAVKTTNAQIVSYTDGRAWNIYAKKKLT